MHSLGPAFARAVPCMAEAWPKPSKPPAPCLAPSALPLGLHGLGAVRCTLGGSLAKCLIPDTANKLRMPWTTSALPVAAPR
jgi:hypothetical protein